MTTLEGPEKDLWDKYKHAHQGVNELQFIPIQLAGKFLKGLTGRK
jgi:hypothetical protein